MISAALRRPVLWLAALPLLLIPCSWLWWWASGVHPGLEIGRSADLLLCLGCGLAAWAMRGGSLPAAIVPLLTAIAWQALALLWAPVREPGLVWLVERTAAAGTALALAHWTASADPGRLIAAAAVAGSGLLALTCLTQIGDLGERLRIHREAPFGNVNFTVGAALPLAALGLARFLHGGSLRWWGWMLVTAGCAGALAGGVLGGDPCTAVWLGGGAAIATAVILRLPARFHGPLLIAGGVLLLLAWLAPVVGLSDAPGHGAGAAQRVHIWRGTLAALAGPAALIGHGPGAIIAVLPEQPAFAAVWLTVPSFVAHAHAEPLQVLSDGGLVLAGLLGWALLLTIRPLWRRRAEPMVAALLVGWCTAGTLALVESHLSQPGGLLGLAVLAGLSWGVAGEHRPAPAGRLPAALPLLCAVVLALFIGRELLADGGGPTSIELRTVRAMDGTPAGELAGLDALRRRLGPLDDLDLRRARCLGQLGRITASDQALASHLHRVPVQPQALQLARRRIARGDADPALLTANAEARQRAAVLLPLIHANPVNRLTLDALAAELSRPAGDGPAPVQ